MHPALLEQIADQTIRAAALKPPIDAWHLVRWAKLEVRVAHRPIRPTVLGRTIIVSPSDPPERQRFAAAHELAHLVLRDRGVPDTEWNTNWLASAMLHPLEWFSDRLDARRWDLEALREDCPFSSWEAIGRRIVNTSHAVLWVCDRTPAGAKSYRWRSRGVSAALHRPTKLERDVVRRAAVDLEPQTSGPVSAWPLARPDRNVLRVIALARGDELAAAA